nr:hypothetical protein [Tanacetum cinerariifolium]
MDAKLALTDSEMKSDNVVPKINTEDQDEGQVGPNPGIQDKGQVGSNPVDATKSRPKSSHVVHAGLKLEHMDLEATDVSTQQNPEQIDEEFTTTAYLNVQENLKLPSEDHVILKEPSSSTGTMSSLKNLEKELSFTDQFFMEKQQEEEPGKTDAKAEVLSMVSVLIHQDTSSVLLMTTLVINLMTSQSGSPLPTSTATTSAVMTTTTIPPPPPQPQQSFADQTLLQCIGELEQQMENLLQYNVALEERLDKRGSRLYKLENLNIPHQMFEDKSYEAYEDHKKLYDALEKSLERDYSDQLLSDLEEAHQKKRKRRDLPRTPYGSALPQPPPPPPPTGASGASDFRNDHLPKVDSRKDWWKPLPKEERPVTVEPYWTIPSSNVSDVENNWATTLVLAYEIPAENSLLAKTGDMMNFLNWYCRQVNKTELTQADLEGRAYEVVKAFYPDVIHLHNGSSPAQSISKRKAASYPDFGLELLVSEQMWIDDVCTYDICAKYGISYSYSRYGHDYLSKIILWRADLQEHMIAEKDFKNLYPSDFEDLNLLFLQGHLDHLPGSDKRMLSTASQGIQDQAAQSGYEYVILNSKGRDKEQRVHSGY